MDSEEVEKTLASQIKDYLKQLWMQGEIDFVNIYDDKKLITIFVRNAVIDINYNYEDYVTYKVTAYDNGIWLSEAFFSTDVIKYEDEYIKLIYINKEPDDDLFICSYDEYATEFILKLIKASKSGELDEFLKQQVNSYTRL